MINFHSGDLWSGLGAYFKTMNINLNEYMSYDIFIKATASNVDLDLSDVAVDNLDLDVSASDAYILLGKKNPSANLKIKTNASSVNIAVPLGVGVEVIQTTNNITALDYADLIRINDNTYRSGDYQEGESGINILLDSTVSRVNIVR